VSDKYNTLKSFLKLLSSFAIKILEPYAARLSHVRRMIKTLHSVNYIVAFVAKAIMLFEAILTNIITVANMRHVVERVVLATFLTTTVIFIAIIPNNIVVNVVD